MGNSLGYEAIGKERKRYQDFRYTTGLKYLHLEEMYKDLESKVEPPDSLSGLPHPLDTKVQVDKSLLVWLLKTALEKVAIGAYAEGHL